MQRTLELKAASAGGRAKAKLLGEARTLNDAMRKYKEEVSPGKRGWRWEFVRIDAITTTHPEWPGERRMSELDEQDLIAWRDARAKVVKGSTMLREMALVNAVLDTARRDWGWLERNPLTDVRKPPTPAHRERVISFAEVRGMLRALGWSRHRGNDKSQRKVVAHCFIAALQTGMRAGEICNLRWADVKSSYCVLRAGETKTGRGREVPLTPSAKRNIEALRGRDDERVFAVDAASLDAQFRYYRTKAKLKGFTFHDSRHTAATHMAQKIHVLDLCKVFGWTDPKRAMIYYNPTGADIAARLSAAASSSPTL
ncbi:MAG: site-specific integrase [Comamonas sp.]|uniref:tyrosine-type recombinase/integrase n=1 Tax=Comamonas sp. TaxID=34028 RepID=UPI002827CD7D|nr:site-specific integrase [Comamonas sp.]MDR0216118.1 site-specific integrase [Comamonas sp.]